MPQRHRRLVVILLSASLLAACAPLTPQRSLDRKPQAQLDAAARVAMFPTGTAAPMAVIEIGPVEAHSCQFWEFEGEASVDDAIRRLQFAAMEAGADGIIEISKGRDEGNRWANRCWTSYVARGKAVKFDRTAVATAAPTAAPATPAAAPAVVAATEEPIGTTTTLTARGEGRPELMDWIRRLAIPRGNFIARGPGDGNLDWIGVDAEIGAWQVRLPRAGGGTAGSHLTAAGIALEPGVSRLLLNSRQLGYEMSASWTYSASGSWDMADQHLRRLP